MFLGLTHSPYWFSVYCYHSCKEIIFIFFLDEYSLKITDVQMSDDGEYKCHVLKTATESGIKTDPPVTLTVLGMI